MGKTKPLRIGTVPLSCELEVQCKCQATRPHSVVNLVVFETEWPKTLQKLEPLGIGLFEIKIIKRQRVDQDVGCVGAFPVVQRHNFMGKRGCVSCVSCFLIEALTCSMRLVVGHHPKDPGSSPSGVAITQDVLQQAAPASHLTNPGSNPGGGGNICWFVFRFGFVCLYVP